MHAEDDAVKLPEEDHGPRLLHYMVATSSTVDPVVSRLEVCPAVVHERAPNRDLPLHCACLNSGPAARAIMLAVIKAGPELVGARGREEALPLHISCANSPDVACVKDLIAMYPGAAVMKTRRGDLPVHHACLNQTAAALDVLKYTIIPNPFGVRAKGTGGDLPLHIASAVSNHAGVVQELINEYGEGLGERNDWGDLPVHRVALNNRPNAADILMEVPLTPTPTAL